jgi:hypothetical protein
MLTFWREFSSHAALETASEVAAASCRWCLRLEAAATLKLPPKCQ